MSLIVTRLLWANPPHVALPALLPLTAGSTHGEVADSYPFVVPLLETDAKLTPLTSSSAVIINGCVLTSWHGVQRSESQFFIRNPSAGNAVIALVPGSIRAPGKAGDRPRHSSDHLAIAKISKPIAGYTTDILSAKPILYSGPQLKASEVYKADPRTVDWGTPAKTVGYGGPKTLEDRQNELAAALTPEAKEAARKRQEAEAVQALIRPVQNVGKVGVLGKLAELVMAESDRQRLWSLRGNSTAAAEARASIRSYSGIVLLPRPSLPTPGDSGGGVFAVDAEGREWLIGITAATPAPGASVGLFTSVADNYQWIKDTLAELGCADPVIVTDIKLK